MSRRKGRAPHALLAAAGLISMSVVSEAGAGTRAEWIGAQTGLWSTASRWTTNPYAPNNGNPTGTTYDVFVTAEGAPYQVSAGSVTVDSLTIASSDATVQMTGTVRAIKGMNLLDGVLRLPNTRLLNTSVDGEAGELVVSGTAGAEFDGVTLGASASVVNADLKLTNIVTLAGGTIRLSDGATSDRVAQLILGNGFLEGTGEVVFDTPLLASAVNGVVQFGPRENIRPGIVVRTGSGSGAIRNTLATGRIWNEGTIWAQTPGQKIEISTPQWTNTGVVRASNGGRVEFVGTYSDLGAFETDGGSVALVGTLENGQRTLNVSGPNKVFTLAGGTIRYGTIRAAAGSTGNAFVVEANPTRENVLENVTLAADTLVTDPSVKMVGGVTLENATLTIRERADARGAGIGGVGTIVMGTPGKVGHFYSTVSPTPFFSLGRDVLFTHAPGSNGGISGLSGQLAGRIRAGGESGTGLMFISGRELFNTPTGVIEALDGGRVTILPFGRWVNEGIVRAKPGGLVTLDFTTQAWTNTVGTLEIDGGTVLLFGNTGPATVGKITRNGGRVVMGGTMNTSATIALGAFGGGWELGANGTIRTATIGAAGESGALVVSRDVSRDAPGPSIMDGVTLNADVSINPGATLTMRGAWTNNRTIRGDGVTLNLEGSAASSGNIALTNSDLFLSVPSSPALLANTTGTALHLRAKDFNNAGNTLDITSEEPVYLKGGRIIGGTISSSDGSTLGASSGGGGLMDVKLTIPLSITRASVGIEGTFDFTGRTITLVGYDPSMPLFNTTLGYPAHHVIANTELVFDGPTTSSVVTGIALSGGGNTLSVGSTSTLRTGTGSGRVGGPGVQTLVNEGRLVARGTGLTMSVLSPLVNRGRIESGDGGRVVLQQSTQNLGAIATDALTNDGVLTHAGGSAHVGHVDGAGSIGVTNGQQLLARSVRQNAVTVGAGSIFALLHGADPAKADVLRALSIDPEGYFDLADHLLVLKPSDPASAFEAVVTSIRNARSQGTWDGPGLRSSVARTSPTLTVAVMWNREADGTRFYSTVRDTAVDEHSLIVTHALYGDADLDGVVDADDFHRLDRGFLGRGWSWLEGDFDLDRDVDLDDYGWADFGFLSQGPYGDVAVRAASGAGVVPEPGAAAWGGLVAGWGATRRRKSRRRR